MDGGAGGLDGVVTGEAATERWIKELRELMWKDAGLLRDADGFAAGAAGVGGAGAVDAEGAVSEGVEARNLHAVAGDYCRVGAGARGEPGGSLSE